MSRLTDSSGRQPPDFATVLELAEEYMTGLESGCTELWEARWALARKLPGAFNHQHALSDRFTGQVYRALNRLTEQGKLIRPKDTSQIEYFTPAGWERHQREQEETAAKAAAGRERQDRVRNRMLFFGFDPDKMDLEAWEHLADLLEDLGRARAQDGDGNG